MPGAMRPVAHAHAVVARFRERAAARCVVELRSRAAAVAPAECACADAPVAGCGHCKQLVPEYTKVAKTMDELKLMKVAAIDADANKGAGSSFGVKGFPTIVLALDGNPVATYNGARTAPEIARWAIETAGV